jgi:glycosyltransferase involved in cell wall biosynthesis
MAATDGATAASEGPRPLRILILCATFPPRGGSGVQRVYYQAELLTAAGYDVWVVTEDAPDLWVRDDSFEPQHLRQERIKRSPICPRPLDRLRRKLGKYLPTIGLYPDDHAGWRNGAFEEAVNIVEREGIDVVLVSLGSPSALEVAFRLKQRSATLRLVVDVRDLWVGNPVRFMGRGRWQPIRKLRDALNERRWLSVADCIVNVSNSHSTVLQERYPVIPTDRFHVIQNGFDEAKFAGAIPERKDRSGLLIRYLGFLLPEQKPEVFFKALKRVVDEDVAGGDGISCEFFGGNPKFIEREAEKAGVRQFVETHAYVDHDKAVSLMMGADVLLLFWTNDPGCMCGKFYEYLRAGRHILAFDQGNLDARAVLVKSYRGEWLAVGDMEAHVVKIRNLLETRRSGLDVQPDELPDVSEYSRERQVGKLACILGKDVEPNSTVNV